MRAKSDKIILGGMGMTNDDYLFFKNAFSNAGALGPYRQLHEYDGEPSVERMLDPGYGVDVRLNISPCRRIEKVLVLLDRYDQLRRCAWRSCPTVWTRSRRKTLCRVPVFGFG
ncbi:MAG: hypothetical protein ACLVEU_18630 [Bacteroides cellulosilyticus]